MSDYKNYKTLYRDYWVDGLNCYEIAAKYDICYGTVQYWFKKLGVPVRDGSTRAKLNAQKYPRKQIQNKITVACAWCDKEYLVWPYRVRETKYFYCSKECKAAHWSQEYTGENAFNWKGGEWKRLADKRGWTRYKKTRCVALERDKYQCQLCGSKEKIVTHHIIPVKERPDLIFDPNNLIILCDWCHCNKVNFHEDEYKEFFADIVAKAVNC